MMEALVVWQYTPPGLSLENKPWIHRSLIYIENF